MELAIVNKPVALPIEWNGEQLKKEVAEKLVKYSDVVYTEDTLQQAAKDKAKLNALKNELNAARIAKKKQCLEYYDIFEAEVKAIVALIDEPINKISAQLDVYEQRRIAEKTDACRAIYDEIFTPEIAEMVSFAEVYQSKWMNKTCKLDEVRDNIAEKYKMINTGISTVKALNSKHETALIKTFLATMDMSAVLRDKGEYEQMEVREQMRQQAIAEQPKPQPVVYAAPEPVTAPKAEPEPLLSVVFRVVTTKAKMDALKAYIKEQNIKIERV